MKESTIIENKVSNNNIENLKKAVKKFEDVFKHGAREDLYEGFEKIKEELNDVVNQLRSLNKSFGLSFDKEHYFLLGIDYYFKKQYDKAIEYFNLALMLNSQYVYAMERIATILIEQKKYDEAREMLEKAVNILEKNSQPYGLAYYNMGLIYARDNKINNAIDFLKEKGLNDLLNKGGCGKCYTNCIQDLKNKQYDKALDYYKKAEGFLKHKKILYVSMGDAYRQKNDLIKAREYFEKSRAIDEDYEAAHYNLACIDSLLLSETDISNIDDLKTKIFYHLDRCIELDLNNLKYIKEDKDFENIRNESKYKSIIKKYNKKRNGLNTI